MENESKIVVLLSEMLHKNDRLVRLERAEFKS